MKIYLLFYIFRSRARNRIKLEIETS
jgi:hypothetical protein